MGISRFTSPPYPPMLKKIALRTGHASEPLFFRAFLIRGRLEEHWRANTAPRQRVSDGETSFPADSRGTGGQ